MRCKDYMYREKKSAKLDKVLDLLKNVHFSRRLSMLVTLLSSLSQAMILLLQSASFFIVHFIKRFKLISSGVSSLFLLVIEHFKLIRRFKPISSCQMLLKQTHYQFMSFEQTHYQVTSSVDEINHCLLIHIYYTHVAELFCSCLSRSIELVSFMSTTCM